MFSQPVSIIMLLKEILDASSCNSSLSMISKSILISESCSLFDMERERSSESVFYPDIGKGDIYVCRYMYVCVHVHNLLR